jgi:hypothetical protein
MTRQELETLASENPQELALLFAQKVAGWKEAELVYNNPLYPILMTRNTPDGRILEYPDDWTAVINAGKKAGIKWDRNVLNESDDGIEECEYKAWKWKDDWLSNRYPIKCYQESNWPDCAALMIVMIEVMETKL